MKKQNQIHKKLPRRGDKMKESILTAIQTLMQPKNEKDLLSEDNQDNLKFLKSLIQKEQVDELTEIVIKDIYRAEDFAAEVRNSITTIVKMARFKATFLLWDIYMEEKENAWFEAAKVKCIAVAAALWAKKLLESLAISTDYQKINKPEKDYSSYYETKRTWGNFVEEGLSWAQDVSIELAEKIAKNNNTTDREKQLQNFINNFIHLSNPYEIGSMKFYSLADLPEEFTTFFREFPNHKEYSKKKIFAQNEDEEILMDIKKGERFSLDFLSFKPKVVIVETVLRRIFNNESVEIKTNTKIYR